MSVALRQSLGLHLGIATAFLLLVWAFGQTKPKPRKIKVTIQEAPRIEPKPPQTPTVQVTKVPPKVVATKPVFGMSNKTLTAPGVGSVEVKAGNTIAKEIDQTQSDGADSLPIPSAEYLVTRMPRLKAEIRISYPAEAKAKNVEGAVLMDVLIDESGRVRDAQLLQGPGFGLNEAAMEAIYRFQFEPALIQDKAVAVRIRYAYRFVLN